MKESLEVLGGTRPREALISHAEANISKPQHYSRELPLRHQKDKVLSRGHKGPNVNIIPAL